MLSISLFFTACLIGCGSSSSISAEGSSASDNVGPDNDADQIALPVLELIPTSTLRNSGLEGEVPVLQARANISISDEFNSIQDHVLSSDGRGLAIAISESTFAPPQNPLGDRIEVYNTESGALIQTLRYDGDFDLFPHLAWSDSGQIHLFKNFSERTVSTEQWLSWNVNTGVLTQNRTIFPDNPCDQWSDLFFNVHHSRTDTLVYAIDSDDRSRFHLCSLNLSDSSTSSLSVGYPRFQKPIISSDGSITAVMQASSPNASSIERTHTYDTISLATRNEFFENEGFLISLSDQYRLTNFGGSSLRLMPSFERLDMGAREAKVSESGNLLSSKNPESSDYVRFVTLPGGVVVGDAKEAARYGASTRRISRDGEIAVVFTRDGDTETYEFDIYSLIERTNFTALTP